jgi:hypothetical protein
MKVSMALAVAFALSSTLALAQAGGGGPAGGSAGASSATGTTTGTDTRGAANQGTGENAIQSDKMKEETTTGNASQTDDRRPATDQNKH